MEGNAVTPIISASAVETIGSTLSSNISAIAPALLGVMAVVIVPVVILKLIKRFSSKG